MAALTPGLEDAKKQENGADNLVRTTHGLNAILVDALTPAAADSAGREPGQAGRGLGPATLNMRRGCLR